MIPEDLLQFLSNPKNRVFEFEKGEISKAVFFAPEQIQKKKFNVSSFELFLNGLLEIDPVETKEFEGYDLLQSAGAYDAEGILIWFPGWNEYGSWDCDHHRIITYPNATWQDITNDMEIYINGQWYPYLVQHSEINPWQNG